jgi:hypothetical protein
LDKRKNSSVKQERMISSEMLKFFSLSKRERNGLIEKRMICYFEKKEDFEEKFISNVISFASTN